MIKGIGLSRSRFKWPLLLLFTAHVAVGQPRYTIEVIQPLPGADDSRAFAINDSSVVAGDSRPNGNTWPIVWSHGVTKGLGSLSLSAGGTARGINRAGVVVGAYSGGPTSDGSDRAVFWSDNKLTYIGSIADDQPIVYASGINDSGTIIGYGPDSLGFSRPVICPIGQKPIPLPVPSGTFGYAYAINNFGKAAGEFRTRNGSLAASWYRGTYSILPPLPNQTWSVASAINNQGRVAGSSYDKGTNIGHAVIWKDQSPVDLGTAGSWSSSFALGINDSGDVVGQLGVGGETTSAFLFTQNTIYDLNTLLVGGNGWTLSLAWDINNLGQIVGWGLLDGKVRGFVLTPVELRTVRP